jgi:hypothetical protein
MDVQLAQVIFSFGTALESIGNKNAATIKPGNQDRYYDDQNQPAENGCNMFPSDKANGREQE